MRTGGNNDNDNDNEIDNNNKNNDKNDNKNNNQCPGVRTAESLLCLYWELFEPAEYWYSQIPVANSCISAVVMMKFCSLASGLGSLKKTSENLISNRPLT